MSQVIKCTEEGAILIIIVEEYFILMYRFRFHFYYFVDSIVFFTSSETSMRGPSDFNWVFACEAKLVHCKVLLCCIWEGLKAIVIFGAFLIVLFVC